MSGHGRWVAAAILLAGVSVAGCSGPASEAEIGGDPASVTTIDEASQLHRIHLSADAAARIGLTTAMVSSQPNQRTGNPRLLTAPVAAVLYDADGKTWVYEQVAPLTFERTAVTVSGVQGDLAVLTAGPPSGSAVVTLGAAELRGSEDGVPGE